MGRIVALGIIALPATCQLRLRDGLWKPDAPSEAYGIVLLIGRKESQLFPVCR